MDTFPIRRVDSAQAEAFEPLGSKPKFWFQEGQRRLLFKADDRGTGEDWAEIVACHLCQLLGLPHVEYELAAEYHGPKFLRPGVICENMTAAFEMLVLGNQLLLAVDPQYPDAQRFKVRQHTVDAVSHVLTYLHPPTQSSSVEIIAGVQSALDYFVGYVMLDAWIANQDRHHENWGALLQESGGFRLAPTFDHGASLGRNLTDNERQERLYTRDRNRTVAAFAQRGRSAFYKEEASNRPLGTLEAFLEFGARSPLAADRWRERLSAVNRQGIERILEQVPPERMSAVCREFTLELLVENQRRLLESGNA